MNKEIQFREAHVEDIPQLLGLYRQLSLGECNVMPLDQAETLLEKIHSYPDYRIYLAERDGVALGTFALLIMDSLGHMGVPSAILEDVVVAESCRGTGVGQQMMIYATGLCREKGCSKFFFSSSVKREAAHSFYENLGFKRHGYSFFLDYKKG